MLGLSFGKGFTSFALATSLSIASLAQTPAPPENPQDPAIVNSVQEKDKKSQLGERQRLVERKMAELENKFTAIAEQIRQKEPERADRLIAAYQRAKETLLKEKMNEVSQLLDQNKFFVFRKSEATCSPTMVCCVRCDAFVCDDGAVCQTGSI